MELLIKNCRLANAYQMSHGDLWIKNSQIYKIAENIDSAASNAKIIDGSDYVILPGLIHDATLEWPKNLTFPDNLEVWRDWIKRGVTTYVMNLRIERSENLAEQIASARVRHVNSPLDYLFRVQLPFYLCNLKMIKELKKQEIYHIELNIEEPRDIYQIPWSEFSKYASYFGICISIAPPKNDALTEKWNQVIDSFLWVCSLYELKSYIYLHTRQDINDFMGREEHFSFAAGSTVNGCMQNELFFYWLKLNRHSLRSECSIWIKQGTFPSFDNQTLRYGIKTASTNVAKAFRMYPQKGCLSPGSDADLLFYNKDLILTEDNRESNLELKHDLSPEMVMRKGDWIYRNSIFCFDNGSGRYLTQSPRKDYVLI